MKKTLLTIAALIYFLPLFAQEDVLTFKGIKLGIDKNTFRSEMIRKKFNFSQENDQSRVLFFTGQFLGTESNILVMYDVSNRVYGVIVILPEMPLWSLTCSTYSDIKTALANKYGPAILDIEEYKDHYKKGDGNERFAVMLGKAEIRATYNSEAFPITISIQGLGGIHIFLAYSHTALTKAHEDYIYDDL